MRSISMLSPLKMRLSLQQRTIATLRSRATLLNSTASAVRAVNMSGRSAQNNAIMSSRPITSVVVRSVPQKGVNRARRPFSSLGSPMFPQMPVAPEAALKPVAPGDESWMSKHSGKIGIVALSITAVIIYTYYESGRSKTKVEEGLNDKMSIEPYEVNEIRFLNHLTPEVYEGLSAACLAHFSSTSAEQTEYPEATYPEFVSFVQAYLEKENEINKAAFNTAVNNNKKNINKDIVISNIQKDDIDPAVNFSLRGGHLFDRLITFYILSGENKLNTGNNTINGERNDKIDGQNGGHGGMADTTQSLTNGSHGDNHGHDGLDGNKMAVSLTKISVTYMLVALNMAVRAVAEERVDCLFSLAQMLDAKSKGGAGGEGGEGGHGDIGAGGGNGGDGSRQGVVDRIAAEREGMGGRGGGGRGEMGGRGGGGGRGGMSGNRQYEGVMRMDANGVIRMAGDGGKVGGARGVIGGGGAGAGSESDFESFLDMMGGGDGESKKKEGVNKEGKKEVVREGVSKEREEREEREERKGVDGVNKEREERGIKEWERMQKDKEERLEREKVEREERIKTRVERKTREKLERQEMDDWVAEKQGEKEEMEVKEVKEEKEGKEEVGEGYVSVRATEEIVRDLYNTWQVPTEKRVAETGVRYPIKTYREKRADEMIATYMRELKPPNTTDKLSQDEFRLLLLGSQVCAWAECYRGR